MQEIINELITTAIGLSLLGGTYLVWLLTGVANNLFSSKKWSWRRTLEDVVKTSLMALAILAWVVVCDGVNWFATTLGADISALLDGASVTGVLGGIIAGTVYFLGKAYKNILNFVNSNHLDSPEVKNPDYEKVVKTLKSAVDELFPSWTVDNTQTDAGAAKTAEKEAKKEDIGQGDSTNPLSRRLPNGDTDNGKGWQCSKYSWYLATGIRMHYAPHPDYGPCNGRDMVNYLISKCGYVSCGKINGAIFSTNGGTYGHTGMVVDADNNIVNDANWTPLAVSTHFLNLDAAGAIYCCPPEMKNSQPAPAPTPAPAPSTKQKFKVGDKVVPVSLVDYNGVPLYRFDDYYTISEINGDRAVLTAPRNGVPVIWAAMSTSNIRKI